MVAYPMFRGIVHAFPTLLVLLIFVLVMTIFAFRSRLEIPGAAPSASESVADKAGETAHIVGIWVVLPNADRRACSRATATRGFQTASKGGSVRLVHRNTSGLKVVISR